LDIEINQARKSAPRPAPQKMAITDPKAVDIPITGIMKDYKLGR
ncbi:MAG: hypothetical protein RLZZ365_797, partial [Pseudomonadota bacterium]